MTSKSRSSGDKLPLHGFNNLTKSLSFNIYDVCYACSPRHRLEYIEYIDEEYNADRLTGIMTHVADMIGANILNVARQDYEPQGASVTLMVAEGPIQVPLRHPLLPDAIVAHLDKSHLAVHTYPESHPDKGICTFRADIDVATCGETSPLNALNYLIGEFESDICIMDYKVRGFTRDLKGAKRFIDHEINSISDFIAPEILKNYQVEDGNMPQQNVFHSKIMLREKDLDRYLFGSGIDEFDDDELKEINGQIETEMQEIFYGRNLSS
jgi:S-adenosylmethionine decarboxylase